MAESKRSSQAFSRTTTLDHVVTRNERRLFSSASPVVTLVHGYVHDHFAWPSLARDQLRRAQSVGLPV